MTKLNLQNILIQVDADQPSPAVIDCAVQLCRKNGARMTLVDVMPDVPWPISLMKAAVERAIEQMTQGKLSRLKTLADELSQRGVAVTSKLLRAPSSVEIVREVLREQVDLVIRESKGRRSRRGSFFGTTATRLLQKCPCPLLLVKPDHPWQSNRVAAAVDVTTDDREHAGLNSQILKAAQAFCPNLRKLHVIYAWELHGEGILKGHMRAEEFELLRQQAKAASERQLDDLATKFGMGIGWDNVRVLHGDAAEVLVRFVAEHQCDLLVMGTLGRASLSGLLMGHTAEKILNQVECSVLAVKSAGFVSPVQ